MTNPPPSNALAGQAGIVRFDVPDDQALYQAYMPFIRNGGLFIEPGRLGGHSHDLGAEIFLLLHLRGRRTNPCRRPAGW